MFNIGRCLQAKVSSIIDNGGQRWPRGISKVIAVIIENTAADLLPNVACEDRVIWTLSPSGNFTAKSACLAHRSRAPEVDWSALVWHNKLVPR